MLNEKTKQRMLAYIEKVTNITPIEKADRLEAVHINGWTVVCGKGQFKIGDLGVFFEIDSKLPEVEPFSKIEFLESKHYKIKSQKIRGCISQGLFMPISDFEGFFDIPRELHADCTEILGVTYSISEDNKRKSNSAGDKYKSMAQRNGKLFSKQPFKWLMKRTWGKKLLFIFFGRKKDNKKGWPDGRFPGVYKTDQERCENMTWVLQDKTPFIVTQKCDGSSATYILEKKKIGYEFYVLSRNVRQLTEDQECYHASNVYWELAKKYDIEKKMKDYLNKTGAWFVCWQGEATGPSTQGNPHCLSEDHLYCFHMTDSITGRFDIREAKKIWDEYGLETVPIVNENYILPDDFEEFKKTADGLYNDSVCGKPVPREGFVYYKTTDPSFSFKNVSREYLLKHHQ